jgi:hypothetical protein
MQIVSLMTDYGTKDYYVAELKASLLSRKDDFNIIDISHDIDRFDIEQAAFFLANSLPAFQASSIHVVAVNCNYKRKSEYICFEKHGHFFIGPNNGVFSLVFDDIDETKVYLIDKPNGSNKGVNILFSHAAAYIGHGLPLEEIGPVVSEFTKRLIIRPVVTSNQIRASIIHIDHFENVITNIKKDVFEKARNNRRFELHYNPHDPITFISDDYSDVPIGDPVAFFNTSGYLEIALNLDKASSMLNLLKTETIQINFFE